MSAGRAEIEALGMRLGTGTSVVDLGAGFGMHAIPLAQDGASVVAIDSSALLLRCLEAPRGGAPVRGVCDDLLAFPTHLTEPPDAILCMGDTRLLTCFLEYDANGVVVRDILNERTANGWATRVSRYRKLRLVAIKR